MLFLKQPLILPFSSINQQPLVRLTQNKVSNSKMKPDLYNCVNIEITEYTAPPQQPYKRGTIIL